MIVVKIKGGLGNQMFQYAIGRNLSIKHDVPLGLDLSSFSDKNTKPKPNKVTSWSYSLDILNIKAIIIPQSEGLLANKTVIGKLFKYIKNFSSKFFQLPGIEKSTDFDPSVLNIGPNTYLDGYWQSEKYFKGTAENTIRQELSIKVDLSDEAKNILQKIKSCEAVSLHVRRGDYLKNKDANNILGVQPLSYYKEAVNLIIKRTKNPSFFIFSDDIDWCKENFTADTTYFFVSGLRNYEDMTLMTNCQHNIIANSTFSWWGAWLNNNQNKIVIAPKKWYNDESFSSKDLIPDTWIKM